MSDDLVLQMINESLELTRYPGAVRIGKKTRFGAEVTIGVVMGEMPLFDVVFKKYLGHAIRVFNQSPLDSFCFAQFLSQAGIQSRQVEFAAYHGRAVSPDMASKLLKTILNITCIENDVYLTKQIFRGQIHLQWSCRTDTRWCKKHKPALLRIVDPDGKSIPLQSPLLQDLSVSDDRYRVERMIGHGAHLTKEEEMLMAQEKEQERVRQEQEAKERLERERVEKEAERIQLEEERKQEQEEEKKWVFYPVTPANLQMFFGQQARLWIKDERFDGTLHNYESFPERVRIVTSFTLNLLVKQITRMAIKTSE